MVFKYNVYILNTQILKTRVFRPEGYVNGCNEYVLDSDSWVQNDPAKDMLVKRKGAGITQLDDGSWWAPGGTVKLLDGTRVIKLKITKQNSCCILFSHEHQLYWLQKSQQHNNFL